MAFRSNKAKCWWLLGWPYSIRDERCYVTWADCWRERNKRRVKFSNFYQGTAYCAWLGRHPRVAMASSRAQRRWRGKFVKP